MKPRSILTARPIKAARKRWRVVAMLLACAVASASLTAACPWLVDARGRPAEASDDGAEARKAERSLDNEQVASLSRVESPDDLLKYGDPIEITWDEDLAFQLPAGEPFRVESLPQRIRDLDGKPVRIRGFVYDAILSEQVTAFPLLAETNRPMTSMAFSTEANLDRVMAVEMEDGRSVKLEIPRVFHHPIELVGRFEIDVLESPDGETWCVYRLVCESFVNVNRRKGLRPALMRGC